MKKAFHLNFSFEVTTVLLMFVALFAFTLVIRGQKLQFDTINVESHKSLDSMKSNHPNKENTVSEIIKKRINTKPFKVILTVISAALLTYLIRFFKGKKRGQGKPRTYTITDNSTKITVINSLVLKINEPGVKSNETISIVSKQAETRNK